MNIEEIENCKRLLPHFATEPWDSPDFWDGERLAQIDHSCELLSQTDALEFFKTRERCILFVYETNCDGYGIWPELSILQMLCIWRDYRVKADPCAFVRAFGAEVYERQIDNAEDFFYWAIKSDCEQYGLSLDRAQDRLAIAKMACERTALYQDVLIRAMHCQELARITRLPCPAIEAAVKQIRRDRRLR